jgi:hypothetical protein
MFFFGRPAELLPFYGKMTISSDCPFKRLCVQYVQDDDGTGGTFLQSFCHPAAAEPLPFYGKKQSQMTVPLKDCVQYVQDDDGTGSTFLQSFFHSSEHLRMKFSGHCPFKPFVIQLWPLRMTVSVNCFLKRVQNVLLWSFS